MRKPALILGALVLAAAGTIGILLPRRAPRAPAHVARLPGIVRAENNVYLIENHSTGYLVWHALGIKGATLVHLDTHDDCRYVPPARLAELAELSAAGNYDEIYRRSDIAGNFRFEVRPDAFLYDLGNFIYPCIADGTVQTFYWVVPDKALSLKKRLALQQHFKRVLRLEPGTLFEVLASGGFTFTLRGATVYVLALDELPAVPPGALLDFDIDFFAFATALSEAHLRKKLLWPPEQVCETLRARVPRPAAVTVCASVWGGYLPLVFRFLPDACFAYFATGRYPPDARRQLDAVTTMRETLGPIPVPATPSDPVFKAAHEHLEGAIELMSGRDEAARERFAAAARREPVYAKGLLDAARTLQYMGRVRAARKMLDTFEELMGGETTESLFRRARLLLLEGRAQEAEPLCQRLVDWNPQPRYRLLRGGVLAEQGRYGEAVKLYADVLKKHSGNAVAHYNMGIARQELGQYEAALRHFRFAVTLHPEFAAAHENLGYLLLRLNQVEPAERHLRRAVEINPLKTSAWNNLGLAAARQGRPKDAGFCFEQALRRNPDLPRVHENLAASLRALGRTEEAARHEKEAARLRAALQELGAADAPRG